MANKQDIKIMVEKILSKKGFNIPPLTELEKKELKERTRITIVHLQES